MDDRRTISISGTPEFAAWLDDLADRIGSDVSTLIELGLRSVASEAGFDPPPRRIRRRRGRRQTA